MKLLITGGCGFIGSNFIIDQIKFSKNEIINYDNITYAGNKANLKIVEKNSRYTFIKGDICDNNLVKKTLLKTEPDAIIHFAAESHVDRSINEPNSFIKTNIYGTAILLEESMKYLKLKNKSFDSFRFIHVSTDEVFGSLGKKGFFKETSHYNPSSPYSATKASSDHLARAWFKTYKFPTIVTNCSNNYGPYQFPEKLIPLTIANCFDEKELPVYGKGDNVRDWLYVYDHCKALELILLFGKAGESYNIGSNNEISNIEIINTICKIMDSLRPLKRSKKYRDLIKFVPDRPGHDYRYAIDSTKIKDELGWKPQENFKTGIVKTINWYIKNEIWWRKIQNNKYNQERLGLIND